MFVAVFRWRPGLLECGSSRQSAAGASLASIRPTGNMEGKEVRFGIFNSALFATITTDASCGAVNCMHDSFTPLGGLVPLFNIQTGEVMFGGVGAGLYGMLVFVVMAIFIAGLMVGRTPEYLGKKIEAYDVKGGRAGDPGSGGHHPRLYRMGEHIDWGMRRHEQQRPARIQRDALRLHLLRRQQRPRIRRPDNQHAAVEQRHMAFDMLLGRFFMIIPILALAGHLAAKKMAPQSEGSFPVSGADVQRPADRHRRHRRSADVPAGPGYGADRRALPDVGVEVTY